MLPTLEAQAPGGGERTVWYFYRLTWGHQDEFVELFKKNHYSVLKEQMENRLVDFKAYVPQFHGDGRANWTFATEIVFKSDAEFLGPSPEQAIVTRLYSDLAGFRREEARRFEILDAHRDIPLRESPHGVTTRIGVVSDTHNLVRPEALAALEQSELILYAGDVCRPEVLEELGRIAPVLAVRGNNDRGSWARALLGADPRQKGFHTVVSGHSHQPGARRRDGVLFLNPGSAGPRRFRLPVAVARLSLGKGGLRARIEELRIE